MDIASEGQPLPAKGFVGGDNLVQRGFVSRQGLHVAFAEDRAKQQQDSHVEPVSQELQEASTVKKNAQAIADVTSSTSRFIASVQHAPQASGSVAAADQGQQKHPQVGDNGGSSQGADSAVQEASEQQEGSVDSEVTDDSPGGSMTNAGQQGVQGQQKGGGGLQRQGSIRFSKLWRRAKTAGMLLVVCGGALVSGGMAWTLLMAVASYQACSEYQGFLYSDKLSGNIDAPADSVKVITQAFAVMLVVVAQFNPGLLGIAFSMAAIVLVCIEIFSKGQPRFSTLATTVFGLFYCGYLPSHWILLRNLQIPTATLNVAPYGYYLGLIAAVSTVLGIVVADTGAYLLGKRYGRTQLHPISPNKTFEGALGGYAATTALILAVKFLTGWPSSFAFALFVALAIAVSSVAGDLTESIMKREAGLKDAGGLIPGHGGLLDRFDSYIFTAPAMYFVVLNVLPRFGL